MKCVKCGADCYAAYSHNIGAAGNAEVAPMVPYCQEHAPFIPGVSDALAREAALQEKVQTLKAILEELLLACGHEGCGPECNLSDVSKRARSALREDEP